MRSLRPHSQSWQREPARSSLCARQAVISFIYLLTLSGNHAFAINQPDDAVPPHLHNNAVDTWLVLQGQLKVWAGTTGRVLSAGDFAFVPPGVVHSYQVVEPHTEFIGVIHPSQWVSFFRVIGERNNAAGPYPSNDTRPFPVERFMKAIKDGHDVV